jgi:Holliday junction resolvase
MSGARSCRKGKVGERELCRRLSSEGFPARRGAQHRGGPDSPDVIVPSLPAIHWEAKRCERLRIYDALTQARREAGEGCIPIVAHRKNASPWLAVLTLADLLTILRESDFVAPGASTGWLGGIPDPELHDEAAP